MRGGLIGVADMKKAVAYERVSYIRKRGGEREDGYSFETQRETLAGYALKNGLTIVKTFVEESSAYTPGRIEFERMLTYLKTHPDVRILLVYKLDRLARNLKDYARLVEQPGLQIVSATEDLPENSTGRLIGDSLAVFARFYSAQLSERTSAAMLTKARSGVYPTYAPAGYVNRDRNIAIDPSVGPLIRELFVRYARSQCSLAELAEWAKHRGLRSRYGNPMKKGSLSKILHNPVYVGRFMWRGVEYQGSHEALVGEDLFQAVQARFDDRRTVRPARHEFPYRGLVTCGYCGCRLTAEIKKGKYVYYHCTRSKGKCDQPYYSQDRLSDRLLAVLERIRMTPENADEVMRVVFDDEEQATRRRAERTLELRSEERMILERLDAMYEDHIDGGIGEEQWLRQQARQSTRLAVVRAEMARLGDEFPVDREAAATVLELAQRLPELYVRKSHEERARALRVVTSNCVVTAETIDPVYKPPFAEIAARGTCTSWLPGEDSNLQPFG